MKFKELLEDNEPIPSLDFDEHLRKLNQDLSPGGARNKLGLNARREVVASINIPESVYADNKSAQEKINDLANDLNEKITNLMFDQTKKWLEKNNKEIDKKLINMTFKERMKK